MGGDETGFAHRTYGAVAGRVAGHVTIVLDAVTRLAVLEAGAPP
jgi:hypothetical protein